MENTVYIGPYKVYRIFRKSKRRKIIKRNLTKEEAKTLVNSYPNSNTSMVVFDKQFTSEKYYKNSQYGKR
jgi:hypothetical protein